MSRSLITISGHMKSFQVPRIRRCPSVTRIGASTGITTERKIRHFAAAVDASGVQAGHRGIDQRVLAHQEDAEDAGDPRHDRAGVAVDQAEELEQPNSGSSSPGPHQEASEQQPVEGPRGHGAHFAKA